MNLITRTSRIVAQFSCGAASAVATKLVLAKYGSTHDTPIVNAYLLEEHPDNRRFAADSERWFGARITTLRDARDGASTIRVFRRRRFMMGPHGAPCSHALKRELLNRWALPGDVMAMGYTAEEEDRLDDFRERNPDRPVIAPLIEEGLTKSDCQAMVERAGIELPAMYRIPEHFEANCLVQDELGPGSWFLRYRSGPRKDERFPLRELPFGEVRRNEELPSCSFFCEMAEQVYAA